MHRALLAALLICSVGLARAQLGSFLRNLVVGDTTAPPDYDTNYVVAYDQALTISLIGGGRLAALDIADTSGHSVTYNSNNPAQFGGGITYKWLSVDGTITIPGTKTDPALGKTSSLTFGAGLTARRLWIRAFWNRTEGFYPAPAVAVDPSWRPGLLLPLRPDLATETIMASANFALSKKRRFSQNAALWQMERQKRSAGTWILGGSLWHTRLQADSSLVPSTGEAAFNPEARIARARRFLVGAGIGYTHTFVFWRTGFIHFSLLSGIAARDQRLYLPSSDRWLTVHGTSNLSEFKFGAGYNGDRWYCSLTFQFYLNADDVEKDAVSLGSNYGTGRLAAGIRLGALRIKGLHKVGL